MKQLTVVFALVALLTLSSCATRGQTGALGGAAGGALIGQAIGRNTGGTLIGAAVGMGLGYMLGNEMDKYDRGRMSSVYEGGLSNRRSEWVNPDTGRHYSMTPHPAYQNPSTQQVCRRAEINAMIDGRPQRTYSTACRNAHGEWVLQGS